MAVAVVTVLLVVLAAQPAPDANIGAGLALLATLPFGLPFGLPWTLGLLLAPTGWATGAAVAIAVGCAWWNVVLHALLRVHLHRRAAARGAAPTGAAAG
ncbi:hypothetical protein G6556_13740 [Cellulomonas sp. IC4_254]|nr:hypothetical protein [Cellulomonas sp. IC4_254]